MKILIVEDSEMLVPVLETTCKRHGDHEVIVAKSLKETDETLANFIPDFVLSDYSLPDGKGPSRFEAYRIKNPNVFIVLMTGNNKEPQGHAANIFLHKPVPPSEIYAVLTQGEMRIR